MTDLLDTEVQTEAGVHWRIGDPERGIRQFAWPWFRTPTEVPPPFVLGRSDPDADWASFQPGPLNARTGWRDATQSILFSLERPLVGDGELVLHVMASHGPCPQLEVALNGHRSLWFLQPSRADRTTVHGQTNIAGWHLLRVPLARDWFHDGENRIDVTTVQVDGATEEDVARGAHPAFGGGHGSGISWGGLELRDRSATVEPALRVTPLPLYVTADGGELAELVDLVVTAPFGFAEGRLRGTLGCLAVDTPLDLQGRSGGQVRVRLALPDTDGRDIAADLCLDLDGTETRLHTTLRACRKWTVHVVPHVHLDLGYTAHQGRVFEIHSRNVERTMAALEETPDYRFCMDGSMILEEYLATRTAEQAERALRAVRDGHIGVNAFRFHFLTGLATFEECLRATYDAVAMRETLGVPFETAHLTDVPSYSWALPAIVEDLGLKGFVGIQNHGRASNADSDVLHLLSPFRWRGPDGSETVTFHADHYQQLRLVCADPPTIAGCADGLSRQLERYEREDYAPSDLPLIGTCSDNEDLARGERDLVARWNARYAYPRLRYSTLAEYLDAVLPLRDALPVVTGDGGSYWEDGAGAHAAAMAAYRRAQVALPDAELLTELLHVHDPTLRPHRRNLEEGWRSLLIGCEHTWTSAHAVSSPHSEEQRLQTAWKVSHIDAALRTGIAEEQRALSQLGERISTAGETLVVFNQLPWSRDADVEVELVTRQVPVAPHEVLESGDVHHRLRVRVPDLPPYGYRAVPLDARDTVPSQSASALPELATDRYRVEVESGRVTALRWLPGDRELLDTASPWCLAEVLYVAGGGGSLYDYDPQFAPPDLEITPATMELVDAASTPLGLTLRLRGSAPNLPRVETRIHLPCGHDRVDVEVRLEKTAVLTKESVYVAFPFFAGASPQVRYDRQLGWVDPVTDHQPGASNEWYTTLYGAGIDGDIGIDWVSVDAPLFALGDIVRGRWPSQSVASATILSWPMNNYWWTNYPAQQGGEVTLRYAFRPAARWDPAAAARFGREVRHHPLVAPISWLEKRETGARLLPAGASSLWPVELPDNVVATVHRARAGDGMVVRLVECGGLATTVDLHSPFGPRCRVALCDGAERPRGDVRIDPDGRFAVGVKPWSFVTLRLEPIP